MIVLRSIAFNLAFYVNLIVRMIVLSPIYFLSPRKKAWKIPKDWVLSNHALFKAIVGTDYEIEGVENLPEGPFIFAPKHQSFWDAYAFLHLLDDPVYILKRELMWIPLFGWYVAKMRMIPIDRGNRAQAIESVNRGAGPLSRPVNPQIRARAVDPVLLQPAAGLGMPDERAGIAGHSLGHLGPAVETHHLRPGWQARRA